MGIIAIGTKANPEEMFTIAAFLFFESLGVNSAQRRMGATRFTATSSSLEGKGLIIFGEVKSNCRWIPALFTRMLRSLKFDVTQRKSFCRSSSLDTSDLFTWIPGNFLFASRSLCSRRPQIMTSFSSLRNTSAKAKPIPVAPPVIRIVFPVIFNSLHGPDSAREDKLSF